MNIAFFIYMLVIEYASCCSAARLTKYGYNNPVFYLPYIGYQLFIISASPNEQADKDKMVWIQKYLPNVSIDNITLCRIGQNKAQIIEEKYSIKIDNNCYLLDDYTKNLNEWENFGGLGIKRLTSVADNSRKLWKGLQIKDLTELIKIF